MNLPTTYFARINKLTPVFASALLLIIFILLAVEANIDLSIGRFALFMDERITFDGVRRILHPEDLKSFIWAVADGGDHRYGRSLWNSMAVFSLIPERIWGEEGQIIAGRMLQVVMIVSTCSIILFGLLRNWYLRLVMMLAIFAMPYSDYYMTMPKPEPLQLLSLALFSYYYFSNKMAFGWYWVFAGLAFGTKISTLPALLIFAMIASIVNIKYAPDKHLLKSIRTTLFSFLSGLSIAIPILAPGVILTVISYYIFKHLKQKYSIGLISQGLLLAFEFSVVNYLSRDSFKIWVRSTFLNTKHGADQTSITPLSWIDYLFDKWFVAPKPVGFVLVTGALIYLAIAVGMELKKPGISFDKKVAAFAITLSGLTLNLAILIGVQRLWGAYLYPGTFLIITGIMILIDLSLSEDVEGHKHALSKIQQYIGYCMAALLAGIVLIYWVPRTISNLGEAANRTNSIEYVNQLASYRDTVKFLGNYNATSNHRLTVMYDPWLFPPESTQKFQIVEFWGPYVQWSEKPDVIVFSSLHASDAIPIPHDSLDYAKFAIERRGYADHVIKKGDACSAVNCYERKLRLPNGGEILTIKSND